MDAQNYPFVMYDALISNYNSPNNQVPLIYNDTRSSPLVKDTTGYAMSIVRFTLDTNTLPIFIPIMQSNSTTNTIYSISMTYNNITYQQYMQYIPQNTAQSAFYYYVYTFEYLCLLINNTFQSCFDGLVNLCSESGIILEGTAPNINYDSTTQLFTIDIDNIHFGISTGLINIYFNSAIQNLFLFNSYFKNLSNSKGLNYLLINNSTQILQDISTIGNLSPILSIVFTSVQLPIIASVQGNPNIYNNGTISNSNSSNLGYQIITDMTTSNLVFTPNIVYVPSGQNRYISLIPNTKISNIDFNCYWLGRDGTLNLIYLNTGCSCTLKILFQKIQ